MVALEQKTEETKLITPTGVGINEPYVLRFTPSASLRLRISVDPSNNGGYPIDRRFDVPYRNSQGHKLAGAQDIRQHIWTVDQHLDALSERFPGEERVAYVGNANQGNNFGYVSYDRDSDTLYHLAEELVFSTAYPSIVSWMDHHISIEDVFFARSNGRTSVHRRREDDTLEDITQMSDFISSGLPLVRSGKKVSLELLAPSIYDTRHLARPLVIKVGSAPTMYIPNHDLQQGLLRLAVAHPLPFPAQARVDDDTTLPLTRVGWLDTAARTPQKLNPAIIFLKKAGVLSEHAEPCTDTFIQAGQVCEQALMVALKEGNYQVVDDSHPLKEGEARFVNNHLEVFFRKALYPHHHFCTWADGSCGFVIWPGNSGKSGTTLAFAADYAMEVLGVKDLLMIDQGGDVRLLWRGRYIVPPSEDREELTSVLVLTRTEGEWSGESMFIF